MIDRKAAANSKLAGERIDIAYDYAMCAWARHFNTSEQRLKEAVQAVGDRADKVRDHLAGGSGSERPSAR